MHAFYYLFVVLFAVFSTAGYSQETPQQALNQHVAFLNQSTDEVSARFLQVQHYYASIDTYKAQARSLPSISSSRLLEDYYYKKALSSSALTDTEKQRLTAEIQSLWKLLNKVDQTVKALETYNRLKDFERDNFKKSDALITEFQSLTSQFSQNKNAFYKQIQHIYRRYQPYRETDAYLSTEKELEQILVSQQTLLDTLVYYLDEKSQSDWPLKLVQQHTLADQKFLSDFGKAKSAIGYPASDMLNSFKAGLQAIQDVKKRAVDAYTFSARQNARHGNEVYLSLINQYNNDLLNWQQSFVRYSAPTRQLLDYPKFSPVFRIDGPVANTLQISQTQPFPDSSPLVFTTKPADAPASAATFQALTAYVEFINESLRQMNQLQLLLRNYQSSAEYYRDASVNKRRNGLTYSHETYKVPVSAYQFLILTSQQVPVPYRTSINKQAEVLFAMLTEMDKLSIELIDYTSRKVYEQDHLQRSDAILDRYAYLFNLFDQKKEQLYRDVRRIHESYPPQKPITSWLRAGHDMLSLLDNAKGVVFGVRDYLRTDGTQLPKTDSLQAEARTLIRNEYQNLKGLQRYGRSNGLCPYSPYEDIADHALRLAEMTPKVKKPGSAFATNPYETFYYFFNNELVYEYNKFCELAKVGVLKTVNEPNSYAFQRSPPSTNQLFVSERPSQSDQRPLATTNPVDSSPLSQSSISKTDDRSVTVIRHDTVYMNSATRDTIYIDRKGQQDGNFSLAGYAPNNMVLLLDVSASMNSPYKMPLLKKSIKSLLSVLRPEDQISIVVYSGKARIVLKPTSGANTREIINVIDQLESNGDTDGDDGIRLAYKLANKHYIRAGNNRIILATDGEFSVGNDVFSLVDESSKQDIYLTIFTFGKTDVNGKNLTKLAQSGKGTYAHITSGNANLQLILEAQAKRLP